LADFGAVKGKLLCSKLILEAGRHSYSEYALQKNISLWGIRIVLNNKLIWSEKKGSHSANFGAIEEKLLCSKFILEVGRHFFSGYALQKMYHSGALESSSIIN
jgi:hypothetical protein